MALLVSCSHSSDRWTLTEQPFALVEEGDWDSSYRIGGDAANGYYAIATNFGCGRNASTPDRAIRSLLESNGSRNIRIELL